MLSYRVIPVLLLQDGGLVKTVGFRKPIYVGDPINAIKIFNDKEVDELVFLDIDASKQGRSPNMDYLKQIASECFMPLGYGGGITSVEQALQIYNIGIEKVILNSSLFTNPDLITQIASKAGNQSVVVSIDVKKNWRGKRSVFSHSNKKMEITDVVELAKRAENLGAGEIIINSVDQDGVMKGYDLELIQNVAASVKVPVVACGGAGGLDHLKEAVQEGNASAVAAGSMFVFHGPNKAVLINYPNQQSLKTIFE